MKNVAILKTATFPDYVHMYILIQSKLSVEKTVCRIKGISALMIFDKNMKYR